jgi:hypothetical protein
MSISYTGHCRYSIGQAQRRILHIRAAYPEWFADILHLSVRAPGPSRSAMRKSLRVLDLCPARQRPNSW